MEIDTFYPVAGKNIQTTHLRKSGSRRQFGTPVGNPRPFSERKRRS